MNGTVVVVGASVAGVRAAQALRAEGHQGSIVLVDADSEVPYDKPPLSKQFLSGEWDADRLRLLTPEDARNAGLELRLGVAARRLDPTAQRVELADGSELAYDACVLATGAAARPSPWGATSGVHVVRTLDDAAALRSDLRAGGSVVVVGGGFIGAETAATAHRLGCHVTVVDPLPSPIGRVLGPAAGPLFADLHTRHEVAARFGRGVTAVTGTAGNLSVALDDGEVLPARTVVVGIGAVPNDAWLAGSGLRVDNGVLCDEYCRALGVENVYAAGDLARWYHPGRGRHLRVEHWTNAVDQAALVAHNITHPEDLRPHAPVEYVWSDQYDWKIQIVGCPADAAHHTLVGSFDGASARGAALYTDETGLLTAAMTVNWPRALVECRRLVAGGTTTLDTAAARLDRLTARPAQTSGAAT
ncbi:NAD(P)/FAD-dependent oxidoreductase [Streptomyces sp. NPDC059909]|uniref:NAD(P)/FAD-dependent oxidoreductase n=1 Tax=Streptomyces sp. NPDC059909 TaxID=3346998 RepID=UPI00365531A0